jgi:hypothetical protein
MMHGDWLFVYPHEALREVWFRERLTCPGLVTARVTGSERPTRLSGASLHNSIWL